MLKMIDYFQIDVNELDVINSYDYFIDYNNYLELIEYVSVRDKLD
jgi:hypothetical protein